MSSALAGRFLTTAPPGKSLNGIFWRTQSLNVTNFWFKISTFGVCLRNLSFIPKSWRNSMLSSRSWVLPFTSKDGQCSWIWFLCVFDSNQVSFPPKMDIQLTQNPLLKRNFPQCPVMSTLSKITYSYILGSVFGFFILLCWIKTYVDFLHLCVRTKYCLNYDSFISFNM